MKYKRKFNNALYLTAGLAMLTAPAFAQENNTEADLDENETVLEEIIVTGVKSSLERSLQVKQNSDVIVDAISADDIGALPALDIGESLQAIPGIQVNREKDDGSRRQSEISLRGLPGSFTLTTANGLTFAGPALSVRPENGESNTFGSFDSGVFDGVTVYKAQRADLIEGGIAGIVDMQLADALRKKDGEWFVRAEARYEDLHGNTDPGIVAGGTKHFLDETLGFTFKFAWSEQDFRRDTLGVWRWHPISATVFPDVDAWKASHGLSPDTDVVYGSDIRQYSTVASGDRTSFIGGLEFQPSDNLRFGADLLYTQRDLSDSSTEIFIIINRVKNQSVTPNSDPFLAFVDPLTGEETWAFTDYAYDNPIANEGNRVYSLLEEAQGLFLDGEWTNGPWTVSGKASFSDSMVERFGNANQMQTRQLGGDGNGLSGYVSTGYDSVQDFLLIMDGPLATYDQPFSLSSTPYDDTYTSAPGNVARFSFAGNEIWRDRQEQSFQLDFDYDLDWGILESFEFGGRMSSLETDANLFFVTAAGLNWDAFSSDFVKPVQYAAGGGFFGGQAPGHLGPDSWRSIDLNAVYDVLVGDAADNPNGLAMSKDGRVIYKTLKDQMTPQGIDNTADTTQDITAAYLMANLGGEIGSISYWGNAGFRWVETDMKGNGYSLIDGVYIEETAHSNYDNMLPSVNLSFNLTDELIFRFAYSETLNRPSPAGFRPGRTVMTDVGEQNRVEVDLPASDLEAYTADSLDLSLEWYNRKGSAITLAYYQKDVQSYWERQQICPEDGGGLGFGPLFIEDIGGGQQVCRIETPYDDGTGVDPYQREIRISQVVNLDQVIKISGIEIGIQQSLDFLDGFWGGFGGILTASYTDVDGKDDNGLPLTIPRISDETYHAVVYWENEKFNARFVYNWRSEYILAGIGSITGYTDREVKSRGQLDFITRYTFNDKFSVFFKAFNLTEVLYEEFQSGNPMLMRANSFDGRILSLGATYRFGR